MHKQFSAPLSSAAPFWPLRLKDGTIVCSEASLKGMTSYVLLEQEDWFEDEMAFVRLFVQPHMLALDIGANHGVYALTLARRLESGHVWAFEPTQAPATLLQASIAANDVQAHCTLVRAGLSNADRKATFHTSRNSELNSAYMQGTDSEEVSLLALDAWWAAQEETRSVDFVKLDAEGEEIPILQGGKHFFANQSPLILFEYKGHENNDALVDALIQRGYGIYRLLPDINILVPYTREYADGYLLNLFACKADCAANLRQRGLLTEGQGEDLQLDLSLAQHLAKMPFAQPLMQDWNSRQDIPQAYWAALAAIMAVYAENTAPSAKPLLLRFAWETLNKLPQNYCVRLSQVHVLHVLGHRAKAVQEAEQLLALLENSTDMPWPFVPPAPGYFSKEAGVSAGHWVRSVLQDFILARSAYSTFFMGPEKLPLVQQWYKAGGHGLDLVRRAVLLHKRQQHNIQVLPTAAILDPARSPNAAIWQEVCHGPMGAIFAEAKATAVHVLDIGASTHGKGTEPYARLMHLGIARVTGFEPDASACAQLNAMYAENNQYTYLPNFIGRRTETTVFHQTAWFMCSSLLVPNTSLFNRYEQLGEIAAPTSDIEIETHALADIDAVQGVDMIKIDVQGAELDVFEGAGAKLDEVLCIWTGVEFVEQYINQPLFSEVELYLRNKGFALHSFAGIASRGLKDWCAAGHARGRQQAHWSDAIFIRPLETWEDMPTPQLLKLAAILDVVLDARDYCHHALQLLDQRQNTHWAERYALLRG